MAIHIFKDNGLLNLARFTWVKKSWTLKELHLQFFNEYKELMYKWYKDIKEKGNSERHDKLPPYKHPETGELLTYDTLLELTLEQQFAAFFPTLTEENWKEEGNKRNWEIERRPYILKIENTSGYGQDCHFCNNY